MRDDSPVLKQLRLRVELNEVAEALSPANNMLTALNGIQLVHLRDEIRSYLKVYGASSSTEIERHLYRKGLVAGGLNVSRVLVYLAKVKDLNRSVGFRGSMRYWLPGKDGE